MRQAVQPIRPPQKEEAHGWLLESLIVWEIPLLGNHLLQDEDCNAPDVCA
jgi:hypothetical protein